MAGDSAGGKEVGRISIRVVPDLDNFYRDLKAKLEEVEGSLKGKIHFEADLDGVREKVKAETEGMEAKVKVKADTDLFQKRMLADLAALDKHNEAKISLDVDGERFRRSFETVVKNLTNDIKEKIPVDLEIAAGQREKIAAEVEALKKISEITPIKLKIDPEADYRLHQRVNALVQKIKPEVDESAFAKALAEAKAAASAADVKLKVDIRDKEAEAKLAETLAKLKAEAKLAKIKVNIDVDKNSLRRGMFGLFGGAGGAAKAGGGGLGMLGSFADTAALVAAVAAILAPALALVAGALVAIPALLAGILVPIGAVALGFDGIKKAAEAAGLLSTGKKGGLGASLKSLKDTLSQKFQDGFTPIFQQLAPLIPVIGQGLLPVADGVIKIAQALTGVVTKVSNLGLIQSIFDNIGQALTVAAPGIAQFSEGILKLIAGGTRSLPGFATLFGKMGTAVNGWVTKVSTPDFWGTSQLDRGLSNFQTILGKIGGVIGDIFTKSFDMLADPKFAKDIEGFVDDLKTLVGVLIPALKKFFSDLSVPFHDLTTLLNKLPKDDAPKEKKNVVGKAGIFPGFLDEDFNGRADILDKLTNPDVNGWNKIKQTIGSLFKIPNVAEGGNPFGKIGDWVGSAFDGIDWSGLWHKATSQFTGADGGFNPFGKIGDWVSQAFDGIDFSGIWNTITSQLSTAFQPIDSFFASIPQMLSSAWSGLAGIASTAWNAVVSAVEGAVNSVVGFVTSIPGKIAGIWNTITSAAQSAWDSIKNAASTALDSVVSFFKSLPGRIVGALADLGSQLFSAGANAIGQLKKGLESIPIVGTVSKILGSITNLIPHSPAKEGPFSGAGWTGLFTGGQSVGQQFSDGLEDGFSGVVDRAKALMQQLSDSINNHQPLSPQMGDQLKQQLSALEVERKQLKVQYDQTPKTDKEGRKALQDQMDQIKSLKDQLGLQSDQLGYSKKYGDQIDQNKQMLSDSINKVIDIGKGFATANVKQFESDIGISGNGAIPQLADQGIGWATQMLSGLVSGAIGGGTQIHVNSVDDALAAKQTLDNKKALQYAGR